MDISYQDFVDRLAYMTIFSRLGQFANKVDDDVVFKDIAKPTREGYANSTIYKAKEFESSFLELPSLGLKVPLVDLITKTDEVVELIKKDFDEKFKKSAKAHNDFVGADDKKRTKEDVAKNLFKRYGEINYGSKKPSDDYQKWMAEYTGQPNLYSIDRLKDLTEGSIKRISHNFEVGIRHIDKITNGKNGDLYYSDFDRFAGLVGHAAKIIEEYQNKLNTKNGFAM